MTTTSALPAGVGPLLKDWRRRRRLTQMDLAFEAGVSTRHLSFVETGRSRPSADMVLHLAEQLDVPLRERNQLLVAAGHAPRFAQRELDDEDMAPVRAALQLILARHEPYPALVVDRAWAMVGANRTVGMLLGGVAADLLEPPVNVLRVSLHPEGMAPWILNLGEWRGHLLARLAREAAATGDPQLRALLDELGAYPGPPEDDATPAPDPAALAIPLRLAPPGGPQLALLSTVATFGTPLDVTVAELSIETFFPADAATAAALEAGAADGPAVPPWSA